MSADESTAPTEAPRPWLRNPADALTGMAWFNGLRPSERALWLTRAGSACPADAWEAFKATMR